MEKTKNIPELRFPEFEGEWIEKELGKIVGIHSEKYNALVNKDNLPCIELEHLASETGEILGYSDSRKAGSIKNVFNRGDVLYGKLRPYLKKYHLAQFKGVCSSEIWVLKGNGVSNELVYCLVQTKKFNDIANLSSGSKMPRADWSLIRNSQFLIPNSLPEQQKIASFLTAVDEKLNSLKKKKELLEEYKKGVMQGIFCQNQKSLNHDSPDYLDGQDVKSGKSSPSQKSRFRQLRFKDDNGKDFPKWEKKKLGNIAERVTRKNSENNLNVLTISAQQGLINQERFFNKSVSAKNITGYYLLEKDEFAYNKSYSNGYPMGAIKRLNYYDKGVVSTLYICFRFKKVVNLSYMEQYFESGKHNHEIEKVAQEGARNHGLLNIALNDFFSTRVILPSIEEQTKIANFLSSIDKKIHQCQQQIEQTTQWKKGLLQKMFV